MGRQGLDGLFRAASAQLRREVPYDSAAWVATDPASGLPLAPSVLENLDRLPHAGWWLQERGAGDELRVDLRAGECVWGRASLLRDSEFSPAERERVAELCAPLGAALRRFIRPLLEARGGAPEVGPGLLVFDRDRALVSLNDDASA
jgi:hypothetical protein